MNIIMFKELGTLIDTAGSFFCKTIRRALNNESTEPEIMSGVIEPEMPEDFLDYRSSVRVRIGSEDRDENNDEEAIIVKNDSKD